MDRRTMMKMAGMAALGLGLSIGMGCSFMRPLVCSEVCILFLFLFMATSYGLNIPRIPLSSTLFDGVTTKYDFNFDNLSNNIRYNVILRLTKKEATDYIDVVENKYNFGIKVDLRDSDDSLIEHKDITKDSKIPYTWARDYIELTLASFKAKHQKAYHLSLDFNNNDHFFDLFMNMSNQIFVEEEHNSAALLWLNALHSLSRAILLASFLTTAITISLLVWQKKRMRAEIVN